MARKTRVCFPGAIYHVMMRGNERARIFYGSKDYELFLEALNQALERFQVTLHAYCLMPNHVHLAIQTPEANLSRFMAWLQTTFTVRYNRKHRRNGHLFQGRYRAEIVDQADYGRWLLLYIHLNPIRSRAGGKLHYTGGLQDLNAFPWSSHLDYAGLRTASKTLTQEWLQEWNSKPTKARKAYLQDIQRQIGVKEPLDWKSHVKMGLVAGNEEFTDKVQALLSKKGKETGRDIRLKLEKGSRKARLRKWLEQEPDLRNKIWIRVKLMGESQVALAGELKYKSSVSIHQIAKRVEERSERDSTLRKKIQSWRNLLNVQD
ncbi:MAG: transposase [Blastochloris sp.]|nr:transposase [Blastochloris sp.]